MRIRSTALLLIVGTLLTSTHAGAQDLFGRTEAKYDLTGSPVVKNVLDYAYIEGGATTFAERKGLASLPTVEVRRNFVYVEDSDGTLNIPWQTQDDVFDSFNFGLNQLYQVEPDEFVFVYFFTAFETGLGAFFFSPEANTDLGIGSDLYDANGFSPREGFVFMNYWRSFDDLFQGAPEEVIRAQARSVFNQEAGHRWASFVPVGSGVNGSGTDIMLGRDDGHWSYFMQTNGSPMEGNAWRDNLNGTFTTVTSFDNWHFSDLDLYLMGVLPSTDVLDWFVIMSPDTMGQPDLFGQTITRSSPPQIIQPVTVSGTRLNRSLSDVQAQHGLRDPAAGAAPSSWRVAYVMLAGQFDTLTESQKVEFEGLVDDYSLGFRQGARDLAELDYLLMAEPKSPIGGPCENVDDCDELEANICLAAIGTPPDGLCTRPCSSPNSCPSDYCCQEFTGAAGTVCLPQDMCQAGCTCDVTLGSCDQGCDCDTECVNPCACDTDQNCQEGCSCDPNCMQGCECDTSSACEANCSCDQNCVDTCSCDTSFGCDLDSNSAMCECDPECTACTCDTSFACDNGCNCDPECAAMRRGGSGRRDHGGCTCAGIPSQSDDLPWLSFLLVSLLGIAFTRQRR